MNTLPYEGLSRDAIDAALEELRAHDLPVDDGRAWGYVYDAGPEVAAVQKAALTKFMSLNGLDPTVFPSLEKLENDVVGWCLAHLHAPEGAVGSFTSGGTESCMLAVKAARDYAKQTRPEVTAPEMILPTTAHAAFHKGASYFGVKVVPVSVDPQTFRANVDEVRAKITDQTVLLVGSAAGYAHGVIDPIEELGAIAEERGLLLHVDGCIGGFLLNLFEELGEDIPPFDFRVPGVTSISMDLHKYGFAPKGASVLLHRDPEVRRAQYFACAAWSGYSVVNATMQSTKSGGPLAGAWAVMRFLGKEGYLRLAKDILDGTKRLLAEIPRIDGLRVLGEPSMGLIAVASDEIDVFQLCDELGERGWFVVPQLTFGNSPRNLHLAVEAANAHKTEAFLDDLRACVRICRETPAEPPPAPVLQLARSLTPEALRASYGELMKMVGAEGGLPRRRGPINHIIDALPTETKEELLKQFLGELFR